MERVKWKGKRQRKKGDRITEGTIVTGEMEMKKAARKGDRITEGTVVTGEMDGEKAT